MVPLCAKENEIYESFHQSVIISSFFSYHQSVIISSFFFFFFNITLRATFPLFDITSLINS